MRTIEDITDIVKLQEAINGDIRTDKQARKRYEQFMDEASRLSKSELQVFSQIRLTRMMKHIPFMESERMVLSDEDHKQYM